MLSVTVDCLDEDAARGFAEVLIGLGLDGVERHEATVSVPWGGSPSFAIDVYSLAVNEGYAADQTAARQMVATLAQLPGVRT